ncbi:class I SAM-dependent DNA methyltransferase [Deinococcus peraridilitoris]|uniref:class I SAM-dependent DNA methyltransferase n=1 Tax=Deinococcus peraridilitoris TaxID=432329 RepID=UPI00059E7973|nr:class I SAM-dependent methyltransferase [Deinococcus peraridilitoris]
MQRPPFTALASVYDAIMADIEYDAWADFVLDYLRAEGEVPRSMLDLACGTGASSGPFVTRGLEVTGLDASGNMLKVAAEKLPGVRFVQGDLRHFELGEQFDLITCLFDSLNNLTEAHELGQALSRARAHLKPGGVLVFDVNSRLGVRELWEDDAIEGLATMPDGREVHYHWSHHYDPGRDLGIVQAFCRLEGEEFVEVHEERGYDPADLEPLLRAAGFGRWQFGEFPDYAAPEADTARFWTFAHNAWPGEGLPAAGPEAA